MKEIEAVKSTMKAFYGSFNRKEKDEIRVFWLPDQTSECMIPGFPKAVSFQ